MQLLLMFLMKYDCWHYGTFKYVSLIIVKIRSLDWLSGLQSHIDFKKDTLGCKLLLLFCG